MNILVLTRAPGSACEYYRGIGAFSKIKGVNLRLEPEVGWSTLAQIDVVLAERPFSRSDLEIVSMAKDFNVPVLVDVDDDFFNVPKYNPAIATFGQPDVQKRHSECLALADVVMVTCEHLKDRLSGFNKNIKVIPNAFNDFNYKMEPPRPPRERTIAWRGSATHRDDLRSCLEGMQDVQAEFLNKWLFIGNDLWYVRESLDPEKSVFIPEQTTTQYWKLIHKVAPTFWHVPLLDNVFNRSKSNIAWIEATYAGALCIGPDMPEWKRPGLVNYTQGEFAETMREAIAMSDHEIEDHVRDSYEFIIDNLRLSKVNEQRKEILEQLCAR